MTRGTIIVVVRVLSPILPEVHSLIIDKRYDRDHGQEVSTTRGIAVCIPSTKHEKRRLPYGRHLYG